MEAAHTRQAQPVRPMLNGCFLCLIQKQSRIVDETKRMVPDTKERLESVVDELRSLLVGP